MRSPSPFSNSRGQSLIQVLVVVVIMSVISLGLAGIISDMMKAQSSLLEKVATVDATNSLTRAFLDPNICGAQLNQGGPTDLTVPNQSKSYAVIRMGILPTSPILVQQGQPLPGYPPGKMIVQSISLKKINVVSGTTFIGDLEIAITPATSLSPIKPFGIHNLEFTVALPLTAATIATCGSDPTPAGTLCGIQWYNGGWFTPLAECHGSVTAPGARMACPTGYGGGTPITDSAVIQSGGGNSQWTCFKL